MMLKKYLNRGKLGVNIMVIMLTFTVALVMAVFLCVKYYATNVMMKNYTEEYVKEIHKNFEFNIELLIRELNSDSLAFTINNKIYDILLNKELSDEEKRIELEPMIAGLYKDIDKVSNIVITTNAGENFSFAKSGNTFTMCGTDFIKSNRYGFFVNDECRYDENGTAYVVFGKKFINYYTSYDIGYLQFFVSEENIYDIYKYSNLKNDETFLTVDSKIISHPKKEMLGKDIYIPYEVEGKNAANYISIYRYTRPVLSDVSLVSIISNRYLYESIDNYNRGIAIILLIIFFVVITASLILSKSSSYSIRNLSGKIVDYAHGKTNDFQVSKNSEVIDLENSFEILVNEISALVGKIEDEKRRQRIAELAALQSQINPHFLYNSLDTICWMAKLENQSEIEQACRALASFFRIGLHKGDRMITIREEIKHIQSYVYFEQLRHRDKFTVSYDIEPEVYELYTLKIILQPLVENSINHGFANIKHGGEIFIKICMCDDGVIFKVIDNGKGLSRDPLKRNDEKSDIQIGYGVYNVNQRIVLEYGEGYGVKYEETPGGGTTAIVKIKRITEYSE